MTLESEILHLRQENADLRKQLADLLARLNKTSSNSSKPPSTDIKRTKSLRLSTGKQAGGQPGHIGTTLCLSDFPDEVTAHKVQQCNGCGKDLRGVGTLRYERRQVYDIPPVCMKIHEHRSEIKCCPHCQHENTGTFPAHVSHSTQYGSHVKGLAIYLTQYQLLPLGRSVQMIADLTGHQLSAATLVNMTASCSSGLSGFMELLKDSLRQAPVLHSDETGFYYEGNRNWLHVAATDHLTCYYAHPRRGKAAIDDMGILPDYRGTVMHDFWKSYLDYSCTHSLCNVHHLRDLTFCHEQEKSQWAANMKALLLEIKQQTEQAKHQGLQSLSDHQLQQLVQRYDLLVAEGAIEHPLTTTRQPGKRGAVKKSKTQNLLKRFTDYRQDIIRFARDFCVPFGNNIAEQAIRMMKVKQKISGCFRSKEGAQHFAVIRSYIDTMRKNGFSIINAIQQTIAGKPILPHNLLLYPQFG